MLVFDIAQKIVRSIYPDGHALPAERDMIAHYDVSRAVVREAMRMLEYDGLVVIRRGARGGAVAQAPSIIACARYLGLQLQLRGTTLADLDLAAVGLEVEAVRIAACRRPTEGLRHLRDVLMGSDDMDLTAAGTRAFHHALGAASGNMVLAVLFDSLNGIRSQHSAAAMAQAKRRDHVMRDLRKAHSFHRRLYEVIVAGESEVAAAQWQEHSEVVNRALTKDPAKTVIDLFQNPLAAMRWNAESEGALQRPNRLPKAADLVAGELRKRIASGELQAGHSLPIEQQLMEQFGLSRPPVREAIRVLEAEGLVLTLRGSHRGAVVQSPSVDVAAWHFGLLLEYRMATFGEHVETLIALGRAAVRAGAWDALQPGLANLLRQLEGRGKGDRERLTIVLSLVESLVEATENRTLILLSALVCDSIRRHTSTAAPSKLGRGKTAARRALMESINLGAGQESLSADSDSSSSDVGLQVLDATHEWLIQTFDKDEIVHAFSTRGAEHIDGDMTSRHLG